MSGGPFRWDLVTPAQLGTLIDGVPAPDLWFAPDLAWCAGKVVARGGNGDLAFIGRSLDSMFDMLSGAFSDVNESPSVFRVPLSFAREWVGNSRRPFSPSELGAARAVLESVGITPYALARRPRPMTFVDVAHSGQTFGDLYLLVRDWVHDEGAQWDVVRTKIQFVGVTARTKTSPNTVRWAQEQSWTSELPGKAVVSVSLDRQVWSLLGDHQQKLTRSYRPNRWLAESDGPDRSERTRVALAEAVALVAYGRGEGRRVIAAAMEGEPALAQPWLRRLRMRLLGR